MYNFSNTPNPKIRIWVLGNGFQLEHGDGI